MKLYYAPPSPFSRKVRIVVAVLGMDLRVKLVATDTTNPDDPIRGKNPLGKIPVLELDDGEYVYDSPVIVATLDQMAGGGKVLPSEPDARRKAQTLEALADGMTDACVLQVYETRFREPHERSPRVLDYQRGKVSRALAHLEARPPEDFSHVGAIAAACALGYLDLRFEGAWRAGHPRLVTWLDRFAYLTPAFEATRFMP